MPAPASREEGAVVEIEFEAPDVLPAPGGAPGASGAAPAASGVAAAAPAGTRQRRGGHLPAVLLARYPGELSIPLRADRPTIVANFVTSLDGIVALSAEEPSNGGAEISGFSEADRFVMALLRGIADAVIVGAGTVRAGGNHEWTSRRVQPRLAPAVDDWRRALGLAPQPTTIVVTARGDLDPRQPGLSAADVPVILATTPAGAERLARLPFGPNVRIESVGDERHVPAAAVVALAASAGVGVALLEGGPHLFGEFLDAALVDELFLTLAPQLLGRPADLHRLGLVEGVPLAEGRSRWASLAGVRRAGDHLFLRYRFPEVPAG